MTTESTNLYEGMFLVPPAAATNLKGAVDHINELLERAGAEIIAFRKWDERRLAFEIRGNKRGVYFLSYFRAAADKMAGLERNCNLSENILRAMFLRAEHIPMDLIQSTDGRTELADEMAVRTSGEEPQPAVVAAGTEGGDPPPSP